MTLQGVPNSRIITAERARGTNAGQSKFVGPIVAIVQAQQAQMLVYLQYERQRSP